MKIVGGNTMSCGYCEYCEGQTPSSKATIKITKDGKEILVRICENCGFKTEIEYYKGPTVSFKVSRKKNEHRINKKSVRTNTVSK